MVIVMEIKGKTPTVSGIYWDTETSNVGWAYGTHWNGGDTPTGTNGRTTSQMKTQGTFTGWDFTNTWGINPSINDGYPYLRWYYEN